jgi:nitroreductase/NAD-dependent dihydropyrimidine dehydrogenase PreA subunit
MAEIKIDIEKCISCSDCVRLCPAIFSSEGNEIRIVEAEYCTLCGHCLAACPADAIGIKELDKKDFPELAPDHLVPPERLSSFLRSRRSCRAFQEKEVPRRELEKLIDIARFAPTGHNSQNFRFTVVQDRSVIRELAQKTAIFYGNLYKMFSAPGVERPPWLESHMRGFRLNWEYYLAGKDRVFRNAPALIVVHAPAENASSAQNCHLAMAHIMLQAHASGLGTCIIGYFINAVDRDPSIMETLEIPAGDKVFSCCTLGYPLVKFRRMAGRKAPVVRWI